MSLIERSYEMTVAEYADLCSKETTTFHHASVKKSKGVHKSRSENEDFPETHTATAVCTYLSYCILILYGHVRDFLRKIGVIKHGKMAIKDVSFGMLIVWTKFKELPHLNCEIMHVYQSTKHLSNCCVV